jgi:hypothetical protein
LSSIPLTPFHQFLKVTRANFTCDKNVVRVVYVSDVAENTDAVKLKDYIADKTPLFYRDLPKVLQSFGDGHFVSPIKETLSRLPTSDSFRSSHFAEITTTIFAEEVMGLRKIYSKLSLLTSENANAFKMDLLLYRPKSDPVEFILGEVKSSPKTDADGLPAGHDKSCFADLFNSFNEYGEDDLSFDLSAAKDNIEALDTVEKDRVKAALKPYATRIVSYAGFVIIDHSTKAEEEITLLATRKNKKTFDVDLLCLEGFPVVADAVYKKLEAIRNACSS